MRTDQFYVYFWADEPFSNFTPCPELTYLGLKWKSTEQLFMWIKAVEFKDFKTALKIREAKTPKEAKRLGRQVKNFDAEHWSKVSYDYMKKIVDIKFKTNPEFFKALMNPLFYGKAFAEASPFDRIWGIGYSEKDARPWEQYMWGENRLGKILTELREQYLHECANTVVSNEVKRNSQRNHSTSRNR